MKESITKDILRAILFPLLLARRIYIKKRNKKLAKRNPQKLASILYEAVMHKPMDWENPIDLNAKIQWLKFYGDPKLWARCADKYSVREYVKERGLGDTLVKIYGKWDNVNSIDWDKLPNSFVLKMNNDSGGIYICKDKAHFDINKTKQCLYDKINREYADEFVEPHYKLIKPCIIAEELLDEKKQDRPSTTLIDYKVWCFNGFPLYILVYYDREEGHAKIATYDTQWNFRPDIYKKNRIFSAPHDVIPKPKCLEYMLEAAAKLSLGHPEVRVDFYIVDGKLYFGEMTLTSSGGYMDNFTEQTLIEMGKLTDLTIVSQEIN